MLLAFQEVKLSRLLNKIPMQLSEESLTFSQRLARETFATEHVFQNPSCVRLIKDESCSRKIYINIGPSRKVNHFARFFSVVYKAKGIKFCAQVPGTCVHKLLVFVCLNLVSET